MMSGKTLIMALEKLHTIMLLYTYLVGLFCPQPIMLYKPSKLNKLILDILVKCYQPFFNKLEQNTQ
jgi:hypothetical protein